MPRVRRKAKPSIPEPVADWDRVICTTTFRPGAGARLVERGNFLRRDDPIVANYPQFFAVALLDLVSQPTSE